MAGQGKILVTGATGNVGRQVVAQLPSSVIRAVARNPAGLPDDVEAVHADLANPDTLDPCLAGVDAVFLIWPLHSGAALPGTLKVIERHTRRVVLLGSGGVEDLTMDGQQELLDQSGLEWTFIRPSTFAANALWWAEQIQAGDVVRGAYGDLSLAMLHEADIASVAVRALTEPGHGGAAYHLTGPEVLSLADQVRIIGEAIGRPLRWAELPRRDARRQMLADGFPLSFVDVLLDAYAEMITWPTPDLTTTVQDVTGVPARTFLQWAADHATDFRGVVPDAPGTTPG